MGFHRDPEAMRRFYDGFHPWYRFIEGNTGRSIARGLDLLDPRGDRYRADSVLEHCCGSGSLALVMAPRCASYAGRDQSEGMLGRARSRWAARFGANSRPPFDRENLLSYEAPPLPVDWQVIAFALHLFPPADEVAILRSLWKGARRGIIVIDHGRGFSPLLSLVEAAEGSWYEAYRRLDFGTLASELGATLRDEEVAGSRVMEFLRPS